MKKVEAKWNNQEASIQNLKPQIGQIAKAMNK